MIPQTCDVMIVGAGPVGMAAAITLAQAGISPVLIDQAEVQQTTSRAAVIHAHTLEVLDPLGVTRPMLAEGKRIGKFAFRDRDRLLGLIRFDRLPSEHKALLMLTQDRTEAIFLDRLAELSVPVLRGVAFTGYRETSTGVQATLTTRDGIVSINATYVIGADGMHSAVRSACDIPFDGEQFDGSFALADVALDGVAERDEVTLFFSPKGLVVVAPLPGGRYRIVATAEDAPERPDAAYVQRLLDARGPTSPNLGKVRDVSWSSRFRLHHRLARRYRKGSVFLAGDAAHAHSPAGGQGMNTGIVDAVVLGRLLSDVLLGKANGATLSQYEMLRRPAAAMVLALTGRMTKAATLRGPWQRRVRNAALWTLARFPWFRRQLALNLSGIARRSALPSD